MQEFKYGVLEDIERLKSIGKSGGVYNCKLNKMPHGSLTSFDECAICDINQPLASTVTARYYKGVCSHKDNMVIEIYKLEKK